MFRLNKWYLDLVTADGTVVICYTARLRWGRVRVRYASILVASPGAKPVEGFTLRRVERPTIDRGTLRWRADNLGVSGEWQRQQPAIRQTLARGSEGAIRWCCRMPLATAEIRWEDRRFAGLGYVESLGMTVSPARLPFRTLHWGRHLSPNHSFVWIDWAGERPKQWTWLDGVRQPAATFATSGAIDIAGGLRLELGRSRDIRDRFALPPVISSLSRLASRRAGSISRLHEHKMTAPSALYRGAQSLESGSTVYETVTC